MPLLKFLKFLPVLLIHLPYAMQTKGFPSDDQNGPSTDNAAGASGEAAPQEVPVTKDINSARSKGLLKLKRTNKGITSEQINAFVNGDLDEETMKQAGGTMQDVHAEVRCGVTCATLCVHTHCCVHRRQ